LFAYIKGKVAYKSKDYVVVDTMGIGYKIFTSMNSLFNIKSDEEIKLHTHLYVREDMMNIFGFTTKEELGIFELLISVSGVGPKAALSVLSVADSSKFSLAIINNDVKILTKAQGVGKKIAQRIILELKDKISKEQIEYINSIKNDADYVEDDLNKDVVNEAVSALMVLGYTPSEANKSVSKVYTEGMDVENIIKDALKQLL
jgi:Holliday junction DNA helicase RuvA